MTSGVLLRRLLGQATVLFRWPPTQFWQATPHEFIAATRAYRELFCAESASEKRRRFAKFKREVEAADKERRWRRDLERRHVTARQGDPPRVERPRQRPPDGEGGRAED